MRIEHSILVPEAIAIAQAHELIAHDCDMRLPQACAGNMILRQHSNPSVDVVHGLVQILQCCSERRIGCDLGEIAQPLQSKVGAHGVVVAQAMVAAALNIQRAKIKSTGSWRAEQKIAQRINDLGVRDLLRVDGKVADDWINTTNARKNGWIEEHIL